MAGIDVEVTREINREIQILRDHYDTVIASNELRHEERVATDKEAVRLALMANEKRLDGMNEFRQALTDQSNMMITRHESESSHNSLSARTE
jgi:hypothetical protein